ncbi:MAG: sensor histidine kinase [Pyrinomonadaceae bacterium]
MRRRKTAIFFLVFGICLVILAVALNVGWILQNLQQIVLLVLGIIFFAVIIAGLILNMIFLFREIRKNEQQDAFLNAVTHELKTPIASIKLYLETLKTHKLGEKKREEFYDVMLADSERLLTTVEQVLHASKTRERQRVLNLSKIEVASLLEDSVELMRARFHLPESSIVLKMPEDEEIFISGDVAELRTAFGNLLDNAIKYSRNDPRIEIICRPVRNNLVTIRVRDNGIGISRQDQKAVFKRFYRANNPATNSTKGTGLGLFIVDSVINSHNGEVSVVSGGEGKGTTFIVRLPVI